MSFEAHVQRLESIVDELNDDALDLESALRLFEEGIGLLRQASDALANVDAQVKLLVEQADGVLETRPFETRSGGRARSGSDTGATDARSLDG